MSISKPFHIISVWIIITIKLFFPEGTQPSWKITEILEGGGYDKHPLVWKIWEGVGGSKAKMPSVGWYGYFSELHFKCKATDMVSHDMKKLCSCLT